MKEQYYAAFRNGLEVLI